MKDLTGAIVTLLAADPAVQAIAGGKVRGGELKDGDAAPAVVVVLLVNTRSPFGPGKARLGLQQPRYAVNCYGANRIQAGQLAGAVSDALHLKRPGHLGDAAGRTIHLILDDGWGGAVLDPATGWPTETVTFSVTGSA